MAKSNEKVTLERTGKANLTFKGKELVTTTSNPDGAKQRWTEMKVFKTVSGKYVTQILGFSRVKGEVTRSTVNIADTPSEMQDILGFGYLAKKIYAELLIMFEHRM